MQATLPGLLSVVIFCANVQCDAFAAEKVRQPGKYLKVSSESYKTTALKYIGCHGPFLLYSKRVKGLYRQKMRRLQLKYPETVLLIESGKILGPEQKEHLYRAHFGKDDGQEYYRLINETTGKVAMRFMNQIESQKDLEVLVTKHFENKLTRLSRKEQPGKKTPRWELIRQKHYHLKSLVNEHAQRKQSL